MLHYIIDGNNLLGKMPSLRSVGGQKDREKLSFMLERFFTGRKVKVSLHFDGHKIDPIRVAGIKIIYSDERTADEMIKTEIERSNKRKNIILISSDNNLKEFARVCSCAVKNSEEFFGMINSSSIVDEEKRKIDEINDTEEFKKLFGAD